MSRTELAEKIKLLLEKADRSIEGAKALLERGSPDFSCSRAYYAAFYAVSAALLSKGLQFSKHSATIAAFVKEFVKTGVFTKDFSSQLDQLFTDRQRGDYFPCPAITPEHAVANIELAQTIVSAIKKFFKDQELI